MKIWTDISKFKATKPVVTIGSFDGVHRGHAQVLSQLNALAQAEGGESVVITLAPHPVKVLHPDKEISLLNTIYEKIKLIEERQVNHLIIIEFTREFAQTPYNEFVKNTLIDKIGVHTFLIGYDNTIGKNKEGNYHQLAELSEKYNFTLKVGEELSLGSNNVSSTQIRKLINNGEMKQVSELLGYNYILSGEVIHGNQIGTKLGFPTANIKPDEDKLIPATGVYVVKVIHKNITYWGMLNIGRRPTINEENSAKPVIEVHLCNFNQQIYNDELSLQFVDKLRDEHKFASLDDLKVQLAKDKQQVLNYSKL